MNSKIILAALAISGFLASFCPVEADLPLPGETFAVSPDHPRTWVNGADNVHQSLRWDQQKNVLAVDVKYSTFLYADNTNPVQENDYTLTFPDVKLDSSSGQLTAHGTKIGILHHGFFGDGVVLDKGVELDVHRNHGRIFASIGQVKPNNQG